MKRKNKKNIVFVFYVFGNHKKYIPCCVYGILKSYPKAYVKVFVDGTLNTRENQALAVIPSDRYTILQNYFSGIELKRSKMIHGSKMVLRWLIPHHELKGFKYAYFGDIDMLIIKESPSLLDSHIQHMEQTGLPFSNAVRTGTKRLTGLHFIDIDRYYQKVGGIIDTYLNDNDALQAEISKCDRNEHFLYNLVSQGIAFKDEDIAYPDGKYCYRPHHGSHLGVIKHRRLDIPSMKKLPGVPDYLNDTNFVKILNVLSKKQSSKRAIIRYKVYYTRGRAYWASLSFIVSIITMLGVFKDSKAISWFFDHPYINSIWLGILIVIGFVFVGFLDKKFKIRELEQQEVSSTNPYFRDTQKMVEQIKKQLNEITMDRE